MAIPAMTVGQNRRRKMAYDNDDEPHGDHERDRERPDRQPNGAAIAHDTSSLTPGGSHLAVAQKSGPIGRANDVRARLLENHQQDSPLGIEEAGLSFSCASIALPMSCS